MSIVIVGGVPIKKMIAEIENSPFSMQRSGTRNPIPQPFGHFSIPQEPMRIVKMSDYVDFKVEQTEYEATWAFPTDFPRQARRVFTRMLHKTLFDEIREKRGLHIAWEQISVVFRTYASIGLEE